MSVRLVKFFGLVLALILWALAAVNSGQFGLAQQQQWTQTSCPPTQTLTFCVLSGHTSSVTSVAFSPDGKLLASGSFDKTVKLWDVGAGQAVKTLAGHTGEVLSVAFSPDGKLLASSSRDKTIKLWDMATGQALKTLSGHDDWVFSVAFSPDGKLLASGSGDETIKLWEVATGRLTKTLSEHASYVTSVAFSPDGMLASGSFDKTIKLWDVATGQEVKTLSGHTSRVNSVALSPDGKLLSSVGGDCLGDTCFGEGKLWDVGKGTQLRPLTLGPDEVAYSVAFSPNGKLVASGFRIPSFSPDQPPPASSRLWKVATGMEARSLAGHTSDVWAVAFSPDGKLLATGSDDTTIRLWYVGDLTGQ